MESATQEAREKESISTPNIERNRKDKTMHR